MPSTTLPLPSLRLLILCDTHRGRIHHHPYLHLCPLRAATYGHIDPRVSSSSPLHPPPSTFDARRASHSPLTASWARASHTTSSSRLFRPFLSTRTEVGRTSPSSVFELRRSYAYHSTASALLPTTHCHVDAASLLVLHDSTTSDVSSPSSAVTWHHGASHFTSTSDLRTNPLLLDPSVSVSLSFGCGFRVGSCGVGRCEMGRKTWRWDLEAEDGSRKTREGRDTP
ncbi:hypothetical protein R3P38DRAFT_1376574 [Favolaschia claudopus]|uniref:Uncharacterized protein n=1 Tax=Favolaschia claudopus TaxID=2862362 RepID=A0AAW0DUX9_9AGAR